MTQHFKGGPPNIWMTETKVAQWKKDWYLKFNTAKIKLLTCLHQRADPELFLIMMNGRTIKQTPCLERILRLNPDLKWNHI